MRAAPGQCKPCAAVAVVMDDGARSSRRSRSSEHLICGTGAEPTRSARHGRLSMFSTRLHSATIRDVVAGSANKLSLTSFVPPKTQSSLRGIAYMSGSSSHTIAQERPSILGAIATWPRAAPDRDRERFARADSCAVDHQIEF